VLGSLAILFPSFFQHRRALRLYGAVIADLQTDTAKPNANVALAAGVWTCGIWNLANLPSGTKASEEEITRRGQAIDVLNQMQRGGAGVALVAALLGSKPGGPGYDSHDVPRALKTIVKMIRNKDKAVSRDGLSAVLRIMGQPSSVLSSNASVEEQPWTHVSLVPRTLLSTCALASPTFDAAVALRADRIDIDFIRVLADAEILENWDACIHAWKEGLQVILGLSSVILASGVAPSKRMTQDFVVESRDGLVRVWQTLLLAQTQLTQELEHLTASPTLASSVAKILVDVLRLDLPGSTSVEATQSVRLGISTQLWSVAKNVFVREWLVPVADEVLATLLAGVDEPVSTQVTDMWCVLTSRVALCASQGAGPLLAIVNRPEFHPKAGPLWSALANTIGKRRKTRQSDFVDVLVAGLRSVTSDFTDVHTLTDRQCCISDRGISSTLAECVRRGQQSFPLVRRQRPRPGHDQHPWRPESVSGEGCFLASRSILIKSQSPGDVQHVLCARLRHQDIGGHFGRMRRRGDRILPIGLPGRPRRHQMDRHSSNLHRCLFYGSPPLGRDTSRKESLDLDLRRAYCLLR
jgi:hypothetical protein